MMNGDQNHPLDRFLDGGLLLLLAVSTVMFGGRSGWGLLVTVSLFAFLLCLWALRAVAAGGIRWIRTPLDLPIFALICVILIQMGIGFPWGWNGAGVVGWAVRQASGNLGPISAFPGTVDYYATRQALILFMIYAGVFYLTLWLVRSRLQLNRLLFGIGSIGGIVTLYGLFEFLSGNHGIFGWKEGGSRLLGTFVNPDTFATYLVMLVPFMLATLIAVGARRRRRHGHRAAVERGGSGQESVVSGQESDPQSPIPNPQSEISSPPPSPLPPHETSSVFERHRTMRPGERESRKLLVSIGCALCIVALVFTMSRGGLIGFLVGSLVFVGLLWVREADYRRRLTGAGVALLAALLVVWVGAEPIFERFAQSEMASGGRLRLYRLTLDLIKDFPVLGTGFGTYQRAFLPYASPEFTFQVLANHAHNEWLQVAAEGGLVALALLLLAIFFLLRDTLLRPVFGLGVRGEGLGAEELHGSGAAEGHGGEESEGVPSSIVHRPSSPLQSRNRAFAQSEIRHDPYNIALTFGCWGAVIGAAVHGLFDFPFRTPANGILLAMLLGVLVAVAGMRLHTEYVELLLPVRSLSLGRWGRGILLAGAGGVALFLVWTTAAGVLADQAVDQAVEILKSGEGGGGQADKPWVVETSKNREAFEYLSWAVSLDPMSPETQNRMARFRTQLAMRTWGAGLSPEGRFLGEAAERARVALAVIDEAIRGYAASVRLAPPYPFSWSGLGWTYGIRSRIASFASATAGAPDREQALAAMRQAIALNPNNRLYREILANYGFYRLEADNPPEAFADPVVREGLEAQRKAIDLDPTYLPEALSRVLKFTPDVSVIQAALPEHAVDALFAARLLEEQEFWPQAKVLHRRAVNLASDDAKPIYYREYAEALTRRGEDAEAQTVLDVVLRFDPQNLDLRLAQGAALARLNRTAEALQAYQQAAELATAMASPRPAAAPSRFARKRARPYLSRDDRALVAIRARFPREERSVDPLTKALIGLAGFHHAQKRDDVAVALWEKAIKRSPNDPQVAFGLAQSYDGVGAWSSAVESYKKAIELDKDNVDYRLRLAERCFENDMSFQAISLWRDALTARPTLLEPRLKLADAYIKLEQFSEALREYERVLQLDPGNAAARAGILRLRGRF